MKRLIALLCILTLTSALTGCGSSNKSSKIGVSLSIGAATRWEKEAGYMEEYAAELGVEIEILLNQEDSTTSQVEDCAKLIDNGANVLLINSRVSEDVQQIVTYAKSKGVPVISYARIAVGSSVDLFVGYDSHRIGQSMGQYLAELVYEGDYILLRGDSEDNNAALLYDGAMRYINGIRDGINVILDTDVPDWSPEAAQKMVREAVAANGYHVDAILAPNDRLAGAAAAALTELGITEAVVITGMDAEVDAAKRIVSGIQSMTVYLDLQELARTAVEQANNMLTGQEVDINAEFDNQGRALVPSHLIVGQVVTRENLDKILIDSGFLTHEEVYGN